MNIGWWQGGIHIEPESEKERLALVTISEALGFDRYIGDEIFGLEDDILAQGNNQKSVVRIEKLKEEVK